MQVEGAKPLPGRIPALRRGALPYPGNPPWQHRIPALHIPCCPTRTIPRGQGKHAATGASASLATVPRLAPNRSATTTMHPPHLHGPARLMHTTVPSALLAFLSR